MAPNPQCAALAAAKDKKGTSTMSTAYMLHVPLPQKADCSLVGMSYGQIASALGKSEQHVVDSASLFTSP